MKIAVIGAGVIGVTTAYELASQGHEVHVYEKRSAAAEEVSFANAGIASPGYVAPWAYPGVLGQTLRQLSQRHTALRLASAQFKDLKWLLQSKKISGLNHFLINRERLLRLATYSATQRAHWRETLHLDYEQNHGVMVLLRTPQDVQNISPSMDVLREAGYEFKTLDADQARALEPALRADTALTQALYFEQDEVGNCRQFTLLLKQEAERLGVEFHFNQTVFPLSRATPKVLTTPHGSSKVDAIVVCAGLGATELLKPLGLRLATASLQGYTLNAAVREPIDAPKFGIVDDRYKVSISRLGQRVRLSGGAELGPQAAHLAPSLKTLYQVLEDWFPGAARTQDHVQIWKSRVPILRDGLPLIGASGTQGVWLNIGHAQHGWTLANGSARLLADCISGRAPELDMQGLGLDRLNAGY